MENGKMGMGGNWKWEMGENLWREAARVVEAGGFHF
jgi:hypothetical protein